MSDLKERGYKGSVWSHQPRVLIINDKSKAAYTLFNKKETRRALQSSATDGVEDCISNFGDEFLIELRDLIHSHNSEWFTGREMRFKNE